MTKPAPEDDDEAKRAIDELGKRIDALYEIAREIHAQWHRHFRDDTNPRQARPRQSPESFPEWVGRTRKCPHCGATKPAVEGFGIRQNGMPNSWCRVCRSASVPRKPQ